MAWNDDSWKDSYDSWKLASPDDDRDDYCDHDDYDVDILEGRAHCNHCPESWYVSEKEVLRQIEHEAAYQDMCERENRRQWWRDLWASIRSIIPRRKRIANITDDDIPF